MYWCLSSFFTPRSRVVSYVFCLPPLVFEFLGKPFADTEGGEAAGPCGSTWASWLRTFSLFRDKTQPKSRWKCARSVTWAKLGPFFSWRPIVWAGSARFTKRYLLHASQLRCLISKIGSLVTLINCEPLNGIRNLLLYNGPARHIGCFNFVLVLLLMVESKISYRTGVRLKMETLKF